MHAADAERRQAAATCKCDCMQKIHPEEFFVNHIV